MPWVGERRTVSAGRVSADRVSAGRVSAGRPLRWLLGSWMLGPWALGALLFGLTPWVQGPVWAQDTDPLAEARERAGDRLTAAEAVAAEAEDLLNHADYPAVLGRDAELPSNLDRARQLLGAARDALTNAKARNTPTAYRDAGVLANGAQRAFANFTTRTRELMQQIERERNPPPPPPPPPPPVEEEAAPAPTPSDSVASDSAASDSVPPDPAPPDSVTPDSADDPSTEVSTPSPPPQTPPPPRPRAGQRPPEFLRQAAESYFNGKYEETLALLGDLPDQGKVAAHGHLLRAASHFGLFMRGGERDYALRGAATEAILACRASGVDLEPNDLFSPRFRDFFAATR